MIKIMPAVMLLMLLFALVLPYSVMAQGAADDNPNLEYDAALIQRGKSLEGTCVACHGVGGKNTSPSFPRLAGQNTKFLLRQLLAFRDGLITAAAMPSALLRDMNDEDLHALAAWYASNESQLSVANPDLVDLGEAIYRFGIKERKVPGCMACHGVSGSGNYAAGYPQLAGQHTQYLTTRLLKYRDSEQVYDDTSQIMADIAMFMSKQEIQAVSEYIAGLRIRPISP